MGLTGSRSCGSKGSREGRALCPVTASPPQTWACLAGTSYGDGLVPSQGSKGRSALESGFGRHVAVTGDPSTPSSPLNSGRSSCLSWAPSHRKSSRWRGPLSG